MATCFLPAFSPEINLCRCQATCMNLGISWWYYLMNPRKIWTSVMVMGIGHFLIASNLSSSVAIPWAETMCPRYVICLQNSSHLEGISSVHPFPVSWTWSLASQDGWPDLSKRLLYHLVRWYTSWGWGPWGRFPLTTERQQGQWSIWKAFYLTHRTPMAPW